MSEPRDLCLTGRQLDLKAAAAEAIDAARGQVRVAEFVGRAQSVVSDWASRNTARFPSIEQAAMIEDRGAGQPGYPHITRELARRQGFALVRLPDAIATGADLLGLLGRQAKESGDVSQAICIALSDGKGVDRAEASRIRAEVRQLIEIGVAMDAELALIETEGN